jgi:hypothetical protein
MKKPKYNNRQRKILNNDEVYQFHDDDDVLLTEEDHVEDEIDDVVILDEDVDLVELAIEKPKDNINTEIVEEIIEEPKKRRGRKSADKERYYVEPKKFDEEIMKYYESGKMSNDLAEMVSKISHKLSYAPNFINYSYREEMVGDGVIRMMKALITKKYNREKGTNPFSYFTRIAFNAFRNRIKKEKHIHETHEKYQMEIMFMSEQFNNLSKNNNIRIIKERNKEY